MKSINKLVLASLASVLLLLAVSVYGQVHKYYPPGSVLTQMSYTVTPPANCVLVLSSKSASLPAFGTTTNGFIPLNSRTFTVTPVVTPALAGSHACDGLTWTATSSTAGTTLPWLTVTRGASGAGPGTVSFQAMSNPQTAARTATITLRAAGSGSSPLADPSPLTFAVNEAGDAGEILLQRQLRAMYQAILGRDPDRGGFAFWTGQGDAGLGQMVDACMTSPEAVGTDWATMLAYRAAMNAGPTFAQYSLAVVSLRTGAQTPTGLLTSLNPRLTTTNVYKNLLGRNPVGVEGSQTPERAYVTIIASAEFQNTGTFRTAADHTNGLYIRLLYFLVLNRDADQGGYYFWVGQANALASGLFYNGPVAARLTIIGSGAANPGFVSSPAFQQRFQ
jgi:hypothetical protein